MAVISLFSHRPWRHKSNTSLSRRVLRHVFFRFFQCGPSCYRHQRKAKSDKRPPVRKAAFVLADRVFIVILRHRCSPKSLTNSSCLQNTSLFFYFFDQFAAPVVSLTAFFAVGSGHAAIGHLVVVTSLPLPRRCLPCYYHGLATNEATENRRRCSASDNKHVTH